jgi:hypothetical protein
MKKKIIGVLLLAAGLLAVTATAADAEMTWDRAPHSVAR